MLLKGILFAINTMTALALILRARIPQAEPYFGDFRNSRGGRLATLGLAITTLLVGAYLLLKTLIVSLDLPGLGEAALCATMSTLFFQSWIAMRRDLHATGNQSASHGI